MGPPKKILLRLTNKKQLKRLSPGIYCFPENSTFLDTKISPRIDKIAKADRDDQRKD